MQSIFSRRQSPSREKAGNYSTAQIKILNYFLKENTHKMSNEYFCKNVPWILFKLLMGFRTCYPEIMVPWHTEYFKLKDFEKIAEIGMSL